MLKLKDLITEAPSDDLATVYGDDQKGGSPAVGKVKLAKIVADSKVQAVLKGGLADGDPNDDKLPYSSTSIVCTALYPTQNEIGFNQSVKNNLIDTYGKLNTFFTGKPNVGGPIVTYAGKYIIDGHHRWSSVYAVNPKAKMECLNIDAKQGFDHKDILKAVHGAIAAELGKVPSADPEGVNLLGGVTVDEIPIDLLEKNPKVLELWKASSPVPAGKGTMDITSAADVATALVANLEMMISNNSPASGAPDRKHMPQTDAGGQKATTHLDNLAKGTINISAPFGEGKALKERFQKIANIIKG